MSVSMNGIKAFKSPLRCLVCSLLRSRAKWKQKCSRCKQEVAELRKEIELAQRNCRAVEQQMEQQKRHCEQLQRQFQKGAPHLRWTNLAGHQFSPAMIALCCQLGAIVGFRAAPKVLQLVSETFALNLNSPSRDAIRNWTCRAGVALLENEKADDWIWMIDHSVQLGKMSVLVVLGIRQSELPYQQDSSSRTLRREDLRVLAVLPSESKGKEQVIAQLEPLADRLGTPLAVVCDGAGELKAAVESLKTSQKTDETVAHGSLPESPLHLVDVKHKISSGLKRVLGKDEAFEKFSKRISRCASQIRQTELDHLVPPTRKDKCRFMNIHREIRWATMVLSQLDRRAQCESPFSVRLREKLGWLVEFRDSIGHWQQWCALIGEALSLTNQYAIYRGGTEELRRRLEAHEVDRAACAQVWEIVMNAYRYNEEKLKTMPASVRCLPGSTELLESLFGGYKSMQRHHNRGTFTTLLAALPTLLHQFSAASIREQFSAVSNKALKAWLIEHALLDSTQSRRAKAYAAA